MAESRRGAPSPDYITVDERIAEFREKYPEGSLQGSYVIKTMPTFTETRIDPESQEILDEREVTETFIIYTARAYRHPGDKRPGIGTAMELYPGRTPYTRRSELQNAETSAWGRAIIAALGADARRGIATVEEIRNRQAEQGIAHQPSDRPAAKKVDTDPRANTVKELTDIVIAARKKGGTVRRNIILTAQVASKRQKLGSYKGAGGNTFAAFLTAELKDAETAEETQKAALAEHSQLSQDIENTVANIDEAVADAAQ